MGRDEIYKYLKNSKIDSKILRKICYYFVIDFTAIQTAQKLGLSRQTINSYYKIIRTLLVHKQKELIVYMNQSNFCKDSFNIKAIKIAKNISYFIEYDKKVFILDNIHSFLPNINEFIAQSLKKNITQTRKNNCAKVLFNKKEEKYLVTKLYKTANPMQDFIDSRIKKFRGLNKDNLNLHLTESQFRYNYSSDYLYETLLKLLNLNTKACA